MSNLKRILFLVGCFLSFQSGFAASLVQSQLEFKYLTINEGLTNNHISSICQDSLGFIRIGSDKGFV